MCGISGVVALAGRLPPVVAAAMPVMSDALRHRGPDAGAVAVFPQAALGHRRLAIIDRTGGAQPMSNEAGTVCVVFNGEIYNHRALRAELIARGHRFRTRSDTEAILHAFEEFGTACVDRLEGMFAFAVYDTDRHRLFVARDRLGKKPLFWAVFDGVLHFASEIKSLERSPLFDDTLNLASLDAYLSLGYILAPETIYRHVKKLEPGHWLEMANGQISTRQYWDIERFDDDHRPAAAIADELESVLRDAVRARLESEVPLGAFLSGGIDSALVTSFMADRAPAPITTTVGFGESAHNELEPARLTAEHLRTDHRGEVVAPDLLRVLDPIVASFDEPFADPSAVPTYLVSAMARRHVTVALSGDGGDEAFAGYTQRYPLHAVESRIADAMPGPLRAVAGMLASVWPRSARLPRPLRLGRVLENLSGDRATAYFSDLCFMPPQRAARLLGLERGGSACRSRVFEAVTAPYRRCSSRDAVQRAEYADVKIYLANDVLVKVDRMSMAHGLEVRCPLLDRRVVEFAFRVPARLKMPRLKTKALLRRVARGRIPDAVLRLPKHGFTAPVREWLAGPYAEAFRADVLTAGARTASWLDQREVGRLFVEHRANRVDHSHALWAIWMLERWARRRA